MSVQLKCRHSFTANSEGALAQGRLLFIPRIRTNSRCRPNPSRGGLSIDPIFARLQSEGYCFALRWENSG